MIRKVFSEIRNDSFLRKCAVVSFAMFLAFFISTLAVESVLFEKIDEVVQNEKGSGVGLYLVRKIMNLQDGNVMVSSEKRKGSIFTLYFSKMKGE